MPMWVMSCMKLQLIELHHHTVHNNSFWIELLLLLTPEEEVNFLEEEQVNDDTAVYDTIAVHILGLNQGLNLGLFLDHVHWFAYRRHSSNSLDTLFIGALPCVVHNVWVHDLLALVFGYLHLDLNLDLCLGCVLFLGHHHQVLAGSLFAGYFDPKTLFLDS